MTDMTLTLDKTKLLDTLKARRDEILQEDRQVQEIQKEIDALGNKDAAMQALADWHAQVAEGLTDGSITISAAGNLTNAPRRPTKHRGKSERWRGYSKENLEDQLQYAKDNLAARAKPLESAIALLEMSTEAEVTINTADYQALLSGNNRRY